MQVKWNILQGKEKLLTPSCYKEDRYVTKLPDPYKPNNSIQQKIESDIRSQAILSHSIINW